MHMLLKKSNADFRLLSSTGIRKKKSSEGNIFHVFLSVGPIVLIFYSIIYVLKYERVFTTFCEDETFLDFYDCWQIGRNDWQVFISVVSITTSIVNVNLLLFLPVLLLLSFIIISIIISISSGIIITIITLFLDS